MLLKAGFIVALWALFAINVDDRSTIGLALQALATVGLTVVILRAPTPMQRPPKQ